MSLFSSQRERWLWCATLVVVVGIYATLGLASTLSGLIYNQGLSAVVFLTCMFLIGLVILTQGLKAWPGGVEIGVALGISIVYIMVLFRTSIPERSHIIEYGVVAVFFYEALSERAARGRWVPLPAVLAAVASSLVGTVDELIQAVLPNRHYETTDIVFNVLASVMAVASMSALRWARRFTERALQRRRVDRKVDDKDGNAGDDESEATGSDDETATRNARNE